MTAVLTVTALLASPAGTTAKPSRAEAKRVEIVRVLNRGLRGLPMQGTGKRLEEVGRRWGVSPFFIIGVAGKESSLGTRPCRGNRFNVWGLASCRTGRYIDLNGDGRHERLPVLKTWGHAYTWFARYVRVRQPHARTAYDFRGYCECDEDQWSDTVAGYMRRLFGVAPNVRYRKALL